MTETANETSEEQEQELVFQLVYASAATRELDTDELKTILAAARRNNQPAGVTGMLLFHEGSFLQALEGDREVVEALFEKIETDPRHTDAMVLYRKEEVPRSFGRWSMGFTRPSKDEAADVPGLNSFLEHGFKVNPKGDASGEAARKILLAFREGRWRRTVDGA